MSTLRTYQLNESERQQLQTDINTLTSQRDEYLAVNQSYRVSISMKEQETLCRFSENIYNCLFFFRTTGNTNRK